LDYVADVIIELYRKRETIRGVKLVWEAPLLRHFTAKFERV
jgi:tryptophanase